MSDIRPQAPSAEALAEHGYHLAIGPVWDHVSVYEGPEVLRSGFARVNEAQGLLWAAHFCQSEICNGGHVQLFANPTGVLVPEAVRGFRLVGLAGLADATDAAVALLGETYPRERAARAARLRELVRPGSAREEWDPFYGMDEAFYAALGASPFEAAATRFVTAHPDLFFRAT